MSGRQEEISLQWDMIEQELQNPSFWGFLSNIDGDQMPTRIDLILDLMVDKSGNDREKYRTFFYFDRPQKIRFLRYGVASIMCFLHSANGIRTMTFTIKLVI